MPRFQEGLCLPLTTRIRAAWEHRRDYIQVEGLEAFRLVNGTGDGLPGLRIDVYAGRYVIAVEDKIWRRQQDLLRESLKKLHPSLGFVEPAKFFWIFKDSPKTSSLSGDAPEHLEIREGDFRFEVHLGEGPHTGLFLDQRENRRRVMSLASGRRCLNLFAYTGAFSVAAAKGDAAQTVSIDLSKNALQWLQRNLALNQIPLSGSVTVAEDVFHYLEGAKTSRARFDLIILDPPTFSRSRSKVFSTERDFGKLLREVAGLLAPRGQMFVSLNTQKISPSEFRDTVKAALQPLGKKILESPSLPPDFRLGAEEKKNPPLKFCWAG